MDSKILAGLSFDPGLLIIGMFVLIFFMLIYIYMLHRKQNQLEKNTELLCVVAEGQNH